LVKNWDKLEETYRKEFSEGWEWRVRRDNHPTWDLMQKILHPEKE